MANLNSIFLLLLLTAPAPAGQPEPDLIAAGAEYRLAAESTEVTEREGMPPYVLKEVLVVAARVPLSRAAIALSASLIDSLELQRSAGEEVASLLRRDVGAEVRSYSGGPGLATVGLWGASSQQTLVLMDGHPATNAFSGLTDLGLAAPDFLEGVEVVRGAGSSLYGANAMGGVIDLRSVAPAGLEVDRPLQRVVVQAKLPWSNALSYFGGSRGGEVGVLGGIERRNGSGWRSNERFVRSTELVGIGFGCGSGLEGNLRASHGDRSLGLPGPLPGSGQVPRFGDSSATSLYDLERDEVWSLRSDISWRPRVGRNARLELSARPSYSVNLTGFRTLLPWAASDSEIMTDDYRSGAAALSALVGLELGERWRFVAGYDVRQDQGRVISELNDTNWSGSSSNHGVWTEAIVRPVRAVTGTGSLRWDLNQDFGSHWTPNLGLAWQVLPAVRLRGSLGTGFRAPTLSDRYWPRSGRRDIRPEQGWAVQAGADLSGPGEELSATAFLRRVRDMISWLPDTGTLWRPTNVDRVSIAGVELVGRLMPVPGLKVDVNLTGLAGKQTRQELSNWLSSELRAVERVPANLPAVRANLGVWYGFKSGLHCAGQVRLCGERVNYYPEYREDGTVAVNTKRLAPYGLLDLELGQSLFGRVRLLLRVANVTDVHYAEQFGNTMTDRDYPMPGQTLSLTLRYEPER